MSAPWIKIGLRILSALAAVGAVIGLPMAMQARVDAGQDTRIQGVEERHRAAIVELRAADRVQAEDTRRTAEALKAVASIVKEMDRRGTMAGREHERDREAHSP